MDTKRPAAGGARNHFDIGHPHNNSVAKPAKIGQILIKILCRETGALAMEKDVAEFK